MRTLDIIDFSTYCATYSDGAHAVYQDANGAHLITGTGDSPRAYTLDGLPIEWHRLQQRVGRVRFATFHAGQP